MLKRFLHDRIKAFERQWKYDAGYIHELIDIDPRAALPPEVALAVAEIRDGTRQGLHETHHRWRGAAREP